MEIATSSAGYMGYKRPCLWVVDGNTAIKVASFRDDEAERLFMKALSEQFGAQSQKEPWLGYVKD